MENLTDRLVSGLTRMGIVFSDRELNLLERYLHLLLTFNKRINLTAIDNPDEIITKHFLDSLTGIKYIKKPARIIDIGSGGGFPGIPLKIFLPESKIVLIDSVRKKVEFLKIVVQKLGLEEIEVYHTRAETLAREESFRANFDYTVSRAVAHLSVLLEYHLPFLQVGGRAILYKARNVHDELKEAKDALEILGGKVIGIEEQDIPFLDAQRHLIIVAKTEKTPEKFPRRPGIPEKRPL